MALSAFNQPASAMFEGEMTRILKYRRAGLICAMTLILGAVSAAAVSGQFGDLGSAASPDGVLWLGDPDMRRD